MTTALFRQQALAASTDRLHGEILLLPSVSQTVIVGFLLCWLAALGYWLTHGVYARKETVQGWLEAGSGTSRVYASSTGVIKQVLVAEGESVTQGQALVIVNGDRTLVSGDQLEALLLAEYTRQQNTLNEQLARSEEIFAQRAQDVDLQIDAARRDLALLEAQTVTLARRESLLDEQVQRYEVLNQQGYVAATDMVSVQSLALELQSDRQSVQRSQVGQQNRLDQLQIQRLLLPKERANTTDAIAVKLSDIARQIAQLNGQRATVVTAPRAGVVQNLQASVGQRVAGNEVPLLTIAPRDAALSAQLLVPVAAAGFVGPGQSLEIRYDAFPFQKFGLYAGEIETVASTILLPHEILHAPVRLRQPAYRVTAVLAADSVRAYGQQFRLKPGMTLSADIQLGERTLLQWLLEPLYSLAGRL